MMMHLKMRMDTKAFAFTHHEMRRVLRLLLEAIPERRNDMPGHYNIKDGDRKQIGVAVIHAMDGRQPMVFMVSDRALFDIEAAARRIDKAVMSAKHDRVEIANTARAILALIEQIRMELP
jgi:hypothetical protein